MFHYIQETCGLSFEKGTPTILYEDNIACIAQPKEGYTKGDITKHISLKFFFSLMIFKRMVILIFNKFV